MSATITVKGHRMNERIFRQLADTEVKTQAAIRAVWYGIAEDIEKRANQEILRAPKGGRTYLVRTRPGGRQRRHVASAPGETHANLSGDLRKSIGWQVHGNFEMTFFYDGDAEHDAFVEFGTANMEARPSLSNAITFVQGNVQPRFDEEMGREFRL